MSSLISSFTTYLSKPTYTCIYAYLPLRFCTADAPRPVRSGRDGRQDTFEMHLFPITGTELKPSRGAQRIFSRCSDRSQDTADPEAGLVPQRPEGSARAGGACELGGVPGAAPRSPRACSLEKHVQDLSERGCSVAESRGRSGEQKSRVEKLAPRQGDAARAARSSAVSCRGLAASRKKRLGAHQGGGGSSEVAAFGTECAGQRRGSRPQLA